MIRVNIRKGLNLPIVGQAEDKIEEKTVKRVAILADDYIGMKPSMLVNVGDSVQAGDVVFTCKKNEGLRFTSPVNGRVIEINRGERRAFESVVFEITGTSQAVLRSYKQQNIDHFKTEEIKQILAESGLVTCLRERPFEKSVKIDQTPTALFITATDTNPLAPRPFRVIRERKDDFQAGVSILAKLSPIVYLCQEPGPILAKGAEVVEFDGPHPAGLVGTHINRLCPVGPGIKVWHVGYQDVIAIGYLFRTGKLDYTRVISLAGPHALKPRLIRCIRGASLEELCRGETAEETRIISGSVFHGHHAQGTKAYLGHFANQVSLIKEDHSRELLGWHMPGFNRFSVKGVFVAKLNPFRKFAFTSTTYGSLRAMVPTGNFEQVFPLDLMPTQLLRAICSGDAEQAQELGVLDLAEDDLALCTFVDSGKVDYGPILRRTLDMIEKEG
jgi:Na+-transporting NADH:ubiquinone oxidoreductase subunit A